MPNQAVVIPGDSIGTTPKQSPGPGTHLTGEQIRASILGTTTTTKSTDRTLSSILSVQPPSAARTQPAPQLPTVGAAVYARITRLTRTHAHCAIVIVGAAGVAAVPFRGLIRTQDVRATEKDRVRLAECFRVGDVVRAVVISLGDQGGYYLSTAGNEFGVVMGWSEEGNGCVPVGWNEVRDEVTGKREERKVARLA